MIADRDNFVLQVAGTSPSGFSGWCRNVRSITADGKFTIYYLATTI